MQHIAELTNRCALRGEYLHIDTGVLAWVTATFTATGLANPQVEFKQMMRARKYATAEGMQIQGVCRPPKLKEIVRPGVELTPYRIAKGGILFAGDCLTYLPAFNDEIFDTVFADPPFNLGKPYGNNTRDKLSEDGYLDWCKTWLAHCVRTLKPGGALFVYNLPRWNIPLGAFLLENSMTFRHWIAVGMRNRLPIDGRLYPAHHGLLYFTKGKPKTFRKIRTPIRVCRHCGLPIRDYGGHAQAMNPDGVNLMDFWDDIPPVRHRRFKASNRKANALSTKLLDRVIEMTTARGDIILDPFGGSGTTFAVARDRGRRWVGIELDYPDVVVERLLTDDVAPHRNTDVVSQGKDEHHHACNRDVGARRVSTKKHVVSHAAFDESLTTRMRPIRQ